MAKDGRQEMIGKRVVEVAFLAGLICFWIGYWITPELISLPLPETLLSPRVANAIAAAASASLLSSFCFAVARKEADAIEVFRPYGLVLIGGAVFVLTYTFPWLFFVNRPRGLGMTAWLFQLGTSEAPSFSLYIALTLSLGGFGLYLFIIGLKGFFSELSARLE
jgi:hypothetical protein